MAVTLFASGTTGQTAGGGATAISAPNVAGGFQLHLDLNLLAAGDVIEVRGFKMVKASGTSRVAYYQTYSGAQVADAQIAISEIIYNTLTDSNAVQFTINQTFGTTRALPYAVVNVEDFSTTLQSVSIGAILGTAITEGAAGRDAAAFTKFFDKATPTGTINSLPEAVPGASGGLPTTNGTKLLQTVDLTASQIFWKKNTALAKFPFMMTDSTTHAPATGLTVACTRSIDGAAFANCNTATATEISAGFYYIDLAASDLNGTNIAFKFTATGADPRDFTVTTQT